SKATMTKPRGGVPRDIEDTGRDLSLKSVWRELRQEGWTRKSPPRSCLNDRYRYILTDGHPNGTLGFVYYLGEKPRARGNIPSGAAEVRLVLPGRIILLQSSMFSQNYLPDIEATAPRKTAASRSVASVKASAKPGFGLNTIASFKSTPSCTPRRSRSASTPSAAISHVADKVFEIEDDDLASGSEEVDDEDSAEVSTGMLHTKRHSGEDIKDDLDLLGSELLADKHDDLNRADQYGAIESGDEAKKYDVDLDDKILTTAWIHTYSRIIYCMM
ncbi:hypothetical protein GN958_ATG05134, partial [Phytophthora infestans]